MIPRLAPHVSLRWQPARGEWVLTMPEAVVVLNDTAADVLALCDGVRDVKAITRALGEEYEGVEATDVHDLLADLVRQHVVVLSTGEDAA